MMTSSPTDNSFQNLVPVELTPLDEENGCFLSFRVNGLWVKLAKCPDCEAVHVYAIDLEQNDIQFSFHYETGDTRDMMLNKITKQLVAIQQEMYMAQKFSFNREGRCVKH